jgi:hypothetical protein
MRDVRGDAFDGRLEWLSTTVSLLLPRQRVADHRITTRTCTADRGAAAGAGAGVVRHCAIQGYV